jgi:hypothetical protein
VSVGRLYSIRQPSYALASKLLQSPGLVTGTGTSVAALHLRLFRIALYLHSSIISLVAARGAVERILSFDVL